MVKLKEVVEPTVLSRATIYRYEGRGKFPARRQMGPNRVRWNSEEVVKWLNTRPRRDRAVFSSAGMSEGERATLVSEIYPLIVLNSVRQRL
jgi:predicted DNA-binding transcriptional regulator AlpA